MMLKLHLERGLRFIKQIYVGQKQNFKSKSLRNHNPCDKIGHVITRLSSISAEETEGDGVGICGLLLTGISWLMVLITLPFSLCVCFKVSKFCENYNCNIIRKIENGFRNARLEHSEQGVLN